MMQSSDKAQRIARAIRTVTLLKDSGYESSHARYESINMPAIFDMQYPRSEMFLQTIETIGNAAVPITRISTYQTIISVNM